MTSDAPTYAGKHVTSNNASARSQIYTKDCALWRYVIYCLLSEHRMSFQASFDTLVNTLILGVLIENSSVLEISAFQMLERWHRWFNVILSFDGTCFLGLAFFTCMPFMNQRKRTWAHTTVLSLKNIPHFLCLYDFYMHVFIKMFTVIVFEH